jgi:hypothetical protein
VDDECDGEKLGSFIIFHCENHAVVCLFEYDPPVWTEGAAEGCMIPDHIVRINVENAAEADTLGERRLSNEHVHCRDSGNGATQYHRPLCSGNSASRD